MIQLIIDLLMFILPLVGIKTTIPIINFVIIIHHIKNSKLTKKIHFTLEGEIVHF